MSIIGRAKAKGRKSKRGISRESRGRGTVGEGGKRGREECQRGEEKEEEGERAGERCVRSEWAEARDRKSKNKR